MKRLGFGAAAIAATMAWGGGAAVLAADPATHVIVIEGMKFSPATLKIHLGDTVVFKNADLVPHTATEKGSKAFDSGVLNRDAEWKLVPTASGTIHYICTLHSGMEGEIVVEAPAQSGAASPAAK